MNKKAVIIVSVNIIIFIIIVFLITRKPAECKDYLENDKCVKTCSPGYYLKGKTCTNSCPSKIEDGKCVDKCSETKQFLQGSTCLESCPILSDGIICVSECPSAKRNENGVCKLIPELLPLAENGIEGQPGVDSEVKLANIYNGNLSDKYFSNNTNNVVTFTFSGGPYDITDFQIKFNKANPIRYKNTPYSVKIPIEEGISTEDKFRLTLYDDQDKIIYKEDFDIDKENELNNIITINRKLDNPLYSNKIKYKILPFSYVYDIFFFGRKTN